MKLKLFVLAAVLTAAAAVQYGGDNMQYDTRKIQLIASSAYESTYTVFLLSCVNYHYMLQGEYMPGIRFSNSQKEKSKKVEKEISKEVFESLFARCLELDMKKIAMGSMSTGGRDGSDVTLLFGSFALTVSIAVWSPNGSTEERDLTQFMEIYSSIYKLAD